MAEFHEIAGAIHVHSNFSDGSKPIPEIASEGLRMGLDYLMVSDHNTLEPKRQGFEGWYDKLLVLIGYEINDQDDRNHYLAFRLAGEVPAGLDAEGYVKAVHQNGGFGIIAHPAEKRSFSEAYPPYPWTDWHVNDFQGIEIWNQLSEWMEGISFTNFLWRILHPLRSIRFPEWETLSRWDAFNRTRRVVGIGGIDVHAFEHKLFGLFSVTIYPYKVQFKSIRTHLLIREPLQQPNGEPVPFEKAESLMFEALENGRCFIVNRSLGDGRGFVFRGENQKGPIEMGERVKLNGETVNLQCEIPAKGFIRLMRNGKPVVFHKGKQLFYHTRDKGVYRIEVHRKRRGWIYSNPIVLT